MLIVLSCAGLLVAYHPYTLGFDRYLSGPYGVGTAVSDFSAMREFYGLFDVPMHLQWWIWANGKMLFWWIVIVSIGTLGIWLVSKAVRRATQPAR